jgi:DNA topoisomerase-1
MGQYGPFVQLGSRDDEEKPRFASLMPGQRMDDVSLDDALKLLSLPRELGQTPDGKPVSVGRGQFGPYVKYGSKYASIKEDDPFTLDLARALEIVAAKEKADAERRIQVFEDDGISVLDGRFGPYVTDGKKNAKVPKPATITRDTDAETKARLWRAAAAKLSLDECRELLAAAPEAKGRFGRRGAAPKKKAVTTADKPKDKPKKAKAPRKAAAKKKAASRRKAPKA